jgi:hypothetical protein
LFVDFPTRHSGRTRSAAETAGQILAGGAGEARLLQALVHVLTRRVVRVGVRQAEAPLAETLVAGASLALQEEGNYIN